MLEEEYDRVAVDVCADYGGHGVGENESEDDHRDVVADEYRGDEEGGLGVEDVEHLGESGVPVKAKVNAKVQIKTGFSLKKGISLKFVNVCLSIIFIFLTFYIYYNIFLAFCK